MRLLTPTPNPHNTLFLNLLQFLVWTTDMYHLAFSLMVTCICLSIAILTPYPWTVFLGLRIGWGIVFSIFYKLFSR